MENRGYISDNVVIEMMEALKPEADLTTFLAETRKRIESTPHTMVFIRTPRRKPSRITEYMKNRNSHWSEKHKQWIQDAIGEHR